MTNLKLITFFNTYTMYTDYGQRICVWLVSVDGAEKAFFMRDYDRWIDYHFEMLPGWTHMLDKDRYSKEGQHKVRKWVMECYFYTKNIICPHDIGADIREDLLLKLTELPQFPLYQYRG